ncbi:hypothetical protein C8J56DRAFT_1087070 [Mycena floridula]|nr:hypothetical protein C8J56DRAFT_1087070 [Mycena floridula]
MLKMFFTRNTPVVLAGAIACATLVSGKAEGILFPRPSCTGSGQSAVIGFSTGVCETIFESQSIQFFTNGVNEDYGFFSDGGCGTLSFSTHVASACVNIPGGIGSIKKLD